MWYHRLPIVLGRGPRRCFPARARLRARRIAVAGLAGIGGCFFGMVGRVDQPMLRAPGGVCLASGFGFSVAGRSVSVIGFAA
jgi:hypothetical protein